MEHDDEEQVQNHVDDPGQQQKVQGPLGIPHGPEDGRAEIVEHHHRHAHKVDAHIQHRLVQHVRRGAHQLQHRPGQGDAREDERHPKGQAGEHRGVHRLRQVLVLAGPVVLGGQHVGAHGEAHKQVDDQVDDRAGRAHGRQGGGAHELAHHHDVRGVEQQLQNAGQRQGDGEPHDLAQQGAVCHVDLKAGPAFPNAFDKVQGLHFHSF